jgi:tight adherence protein C
MPADRLGRLAERLDAAGLRGGVEAFRVQQLTWGAACGALAAGGLTLLAGAGAEVDLRAAPILTMVGFGTGWLARDWWLTKEISLRRRRLVDDLPVAIDLVTLSIMAGESVPAACARTAAGLSGDVGAELARLVADVRSGTPDSSTRCVPASRRARPSRMSCVRRPTMRARRDAGASSSWVAGVRC